MVKKRQQRASVEDIAFDGQKPLPVEVLGLRALLAKERGRDMGRPQRPGFHHYMQITEGRGTHTVDFTQHELEPGVVVHVAPGQVQQFGCEPALEATLVVFEPGFARAIGATGALRPPAARQTTITALFEALAREAQGAGDVERRRALLRALIEALGAALDLAPSPGEAAVPVKRFLAELERSFRRAHEVAAYAAALRCSSRTLTRQCEQWLGKPAKRVIDERVALEARRLLAHGDETLATLARALGFADAAHLGKFFRRMTGETPAAFRARFRPRS